MLLDYSSSTAIAQRFGAMKIIEMLYKIIVIDDNTEISTVEIELLLVCTDNMGHYLSDPNTL